MTVRRSPDLMPVPSTTLFRSAALGTVITLDTFDGPRDVDIAPGAQPGQTITLKELGVGRLNRSGRGAMHIHLDIDRKSTRLNSSHVANSYAAVCLQK